MYPVGQMNVYHNLSVLSYNQQVSAKKKTSIQRYTPPKSYPAVSTMYPAYPKLKTKQCIRARKRIWYRYSEPNWSIHALELLVNSYISARLKLGSSAHKWSFQTELEPSLKALFSNESSLDKRSSTQVVSWRWFTDLYMHHQKDKSCSTRQ